jgi:uncharacterized protein YggU (UPF0235/DUF167 family)
VSLHDAISAVDPQTSRLRLRVQPGARRPGLELAPSRGLKLRVAAPAVEGAANAAVIEALAKDLLRLPRSSVRLHSGAHSRDKVIEIDLPAVDLVERLTAQLSPPT